MHSNNSQAGQPGTLNRTITFVGVFAIGTGATLGVGWVTTTRFWLESAGPVGTLVAFLVAAVVAALTAVAYVELGCRLRVSGGEVIYANKSFGPRLAFWVGWLLAFSFIGVLAWETISIVWLVEAIFPGIRGEVLYAGAVLTVHLGDFLIAIVCTSAIFFINYFGTHLSVRLEIALTALLVALGLALTVGATIYGRIEHLTPLVAQSGDSWNYLGVLYVFATMIPFYASFNLAVQAAGELHPKVTPTLFAIALVSAVIVSWIFHSLVVLSVSLLVDRNVLFTSSLLPTAVAFEVGFNSETVRNLILVTGLLGLFTTWNATLFATARLLYAIGKLGFCVPFAKLHPRYHSPVNALAVPTCLGFLFAFIFDRYSVAAILNFVAPCMFFGWIVVILAALKSRRNLEEQNATYFVVPYGGVCARIALVGLVTAFAITLWYMAESLLAGDTLATVVVACWVLLGFVIAARRRAH